MTVQISRYLLCGGIASPPLKGRYLFFCQPSARQQYLFVSVQLISLCFKQKLLKGKGEYSREDAAVGTLVRRNTKPLPLVVFCRSATSQCSKGDMMTYLLVYSTSLVPCGTSAYRTNMTIYLVCSIQILHMGLCRMHHCSSPNKAFPNFLGHKAFPPPSFPHRPQSSHLPKPLTESTGEI